MRTRGSVLVDPRDTLQLGGTTPWLASREASCPETWPPGSLLSLSSGGVVLFWPGNNGFPLHTSKTPGARGYRSATAPPVLCDRGTTRETTASVRTVTEADTSLARGEGSSVPPAQKKRRGCLATISPDMQVSGVLQRPERGFQEATAASSSPPSCS